MVKLFIAFFPPDIFLQRALDRQYDRVFAVRHTAGSSIRDFRGHWYYLYERKIHLLWHAYLSIEILLVLCSEFLLEEGDNGFDNFVHNEN